MNVWYKFAATVAAMAGFGAASALAVTGDTATGGLLFLFGIILLLLVIATPTE